MKECGKVKNLFGAYLYNDLTQAERSAVENHIKECEACAYDLKTRQNVLLKLKPRHQPDEVPQITQDNFMLNVYKKIAQENLNREPRPMFSGKFVLQPSLAALTLVLGIAIGAYWINSPSPIIIQQPSQKTSIIAANASETKKIENKIAAGVKPKKSPDTLQKKNEPDYSIVNKSVGQPLPDAIPGTLLSNSQLSNSWNRLVDANFTNYSLGDTWRAIAEYQRLIDDYPDTDAAQDARRKISVILGTQDNETNIKQSDDTEI